MLTNQEAKIYLAEQLPVKITLTHTMLWCKDIPENPYPTCRPVLETEWQQIALWVEEKILAHQWNIYLVKLWRLTCDKEGQQPSCAYGSPPCMLALVRANYTTRATAMKESEL